MKTKIICDVCVCAFCKSNYHVKLKNINDNLYWFYCSRCEKTSIPKTTFQSAVKAWNELQKGSKP